jgi:hypothetical protein
MDTHSQRNSKPRTLLLLLVLGVLAYALGLAGFTAGWNADPNYRNVSIDTKVNITGSAPVITNVTVTGPVILTPGALTYVVCNVTVRDYNGYNDIRIVNATLFHQTSSEWAGDENNTHYTNSSCNVTSDQQDGSYANYSCIFPVNYYALNGTWNCTARVNDSINLRGMRTSAFTVSGIYALNITQTALDFGNLSAGDYSDNITANVTNIGNLNINLSVLGYGKTMGDNLSFYCDQGNLSVGLLRFAANATADYAGKQMLNSSYKSVYGLTINKTTDANSSLNSTYWELYADPAQVAFGQCNGTIVFQAMAS